MDKTLNFSLFPQGYRNQKGEAVLATKPRESIDIRQLFDYITSERARHATETLRAMAGKASKDEVRDFKKLNFETVTPAGIFSYRDAKGLAVRSPYLVIDVDDLASVSEARDVQRRLSGDGNLQTALCFVSPSGRGVKAVIEIPAWARSDDFKTTFRRVRLYVGFAHGIEVDASGSDVCRACFLPCDKECFINPNY